MQRTISYDVETGVIEPGAEAALIQPGSIIGYVSYNPGTMALYNAGSSYADIDATNLAVSFDLDVERDLLVRLSGSAKTASNNQLGWGVRESTTDLADGLVAYGGTSILECHVSIDFVVLNVAAGPHTFKASQARVFGAGVVTTRVGGTSAEAGPFVMTVIAL